jgi:hypothetical protein
MYMTFRTVFQLCSCRGLQFNRARKPMPTFDCTVMQASPYSVELERVFAEGTRPSKVTMLRVLIHDVSRCAKER